MSISGEMDEENVTYIYTMEFFSAIKKNEFTSFVEIWMQLERIILS